MIAVALTALMAESETEVRAVSVELLLENNVVVMTSETALTDEYVIEIVVYSVLNCYVNEVVVEVKDVVKRVMQSMALVLRGY